MLTKALLLRSVGTVWYEFAKVEGAKIILHVKSPTFRAAKLRGFTVFKFR